MKYTRYILIGVVLIVLTVFGFISQNTKQNVVKNNLTAQTSASLENQQASNPQKWDTKTDVQANVTVVVTPLDLSSQSAEWKFDVGMNTHSVTLDQDMTKSAVLLDDQGREYEPIKWEGPIGGHHREGILTFAPITPYPQHLTMNIIGIGGVDRSFSWILNE